MLTDLRLALRSLLKSPGFTAVIVFTLALGIGANTAIFSFFNGILLRPLPYADAENVVMLKRGARNFGDIMGEGVGLQTADYLDLVAARPRSFSALTAYNSDVATLTGRGTPDLIYGAVVPDNFFNVLGARATVGQIFSATNGAANQSGRLVVLGYALWQTRFGGDPAIIGQTLTFNGVAFTVTGIMPADFDLPRAVQFWVASATQAPESTIGITGLNVNGRGDYLRTVIGRLAPGVTIGEAEKEMAALVLRLPNPTNTDRVLHLGNLRDQSVGDVRKSLVVLLAGVVMVLLIACLNIGNLMLSRATTRQRELSIRLALGASRWQIARQLLAESLLLALVGGAVGCVLSWWGVDFLVKIAPENIPRLSAVHLDTGVLAFAFGLSLCTGIVCGLAPIISTANADLNSAMKAGGDRGGSGHALPRRLRSLLVSGEVALSLILLVSAGLLLRSFTEMISTSWGFEPSQVTVTRISFAGAKWTDHEKSRGFYQRLMAGLGNQPGFQSVAISFDKIGESWIHLSFTPEGHAFAKPEDTPTASYHFVSPGYFRTLGITLLQGRDFTPDDTKGTPDIAIIDASTARHYFPDGNALGKRLKIEGSPTAEIVGVVGDVKFNGPEAPVKAAIYTPYLQQPTPQVYVAVRSTLDVATVGKMIQQVMNSIDAGSPTTELGSMEQSIARPAAKRRFPLLLIGVFSALALLLAGVGIYAVTSYGVAQRTRELGVRLALGAQPGGLVALVLRQGFRPIAIGLLVGAAGSILVAYLLLRGMLYRVQPLDAQTFIAVPMVLGIISLFACWLPARRATRVNPIEALRAE